MLKLKKKAVGKWFVFKFKRRVKYKPMLIVRISGEGDVDCYFYKTENPKIYDNFESYMQDYQSAYERMYEPYRRIYSSQAHISMNTNNMYEYDIGDNYKLLTGINTNYLYSQLVSKINYISRMFISEENLLSSEILSDGVQYSFNEFIDVIANSVEVDKNDFTNKIYAVPNDVLHKLMERVYSDDPGLLETNCVMKVGGIELVLDNGSKILVMSQTSFNHIKNK